MLNTALAGVSIAAGGNVAITVEYSIAAGKGGEPSTYTLTGTSRRDGSATDNDNTVVTPALTGTVVTTPDGGQSLTHLPSNGTNYTFQFTVTNNQTGAERTTSTCSQRAPARRSSPSCRWTGSRETAPG